MATANVVVKRTTYKVGEMLYGQNSLKARVDKINSDQSIDIQFIAPRSGTSYYYYAGGNSKKNTTSWTRVPSDARIRGLDCDGYIKFKIEYDSSQVVEKNLNWWGNYYANDYPGAPPRIVYGDPPYGIYYIPSDTSETVPSKAPDWGPSFFGLGNEWREVPGSYKWERTGNYDDFYGWHRQNNYGPYLNRYQKKILIKYQKGSKGVIESGQIKLTKFNDDVNKSVQVPELLIKYTHKITNGKNEVSKTLQNDHFKIYLDAVSYTTANEEVGIKYEFANTTLTETNAVISNPKVEVKVNGVAKTSTVTAKIPKLPTGNHIVTLSADYVSDNTEGRIVKLKKEFNIEVIDATAVIPAIIKDKRGNECKDTSGNVYKYDNDKTTVYTLADSTGALVKPGLQPVWDTVIGQNYKATYDFYRFKDKGFDCELVKSNVEFTSGSIELTETGQYHIRVVATRPTNGASAITEAICVIDNRIPDPVVIVINGEDEYSGPFTSALLKAYLNTASITFKVPVNCAMVKGSVIDIEGITMHGDIGMERKQALNDNYVDLLSDQNNAPSITNPIFNVRGTYIIGARCENIRTKVKSPLSVVEFKIKRRQTYKITLSTEEPAYMVKAHVNFYGDAAVDSASAFDQHLYRIDDGEWKHYLDDVMIFKNCKFECKSIDEDGFESYVSSIEIKNISSRTPALPVIRYHKGDGEEDNVYELINNTTLHPCDTLIISLNEGGND